MRPATEQDCPVASNAGAPPRQSICRSSARMDTVRSVFGLEATVTTPSATTNGAYVEMDIMLEPGGHPKAVRGVHLRLRPHGMGDPLSVTGVESSRSWKATDSLWYVRPTNWRASWWSLIVQPVG
jgi:hypothetical protein